ncbi:MAG: DUF2892 domain-containing protein [Solirubrobacterales bacterium]
MKHIFPDTIKRVQINTDAEINGRIMERTLDNICDFVCKSKEEINERINELDSEWDIERVLETNAGTAIIISTILGSKVNKKWFFATGVVGGFLLQHALFGWCPPVSILRRLGIRTSSEINFEKETLKKQL